MLGQTQVSYSFDVLEDLNNSRVEEVVPPSVGHECSHNWAKQIVSHNITVVELIFETNYLSAKPQRS